MRGAWKSAFLLTTLGGLAACLTAADTPEIATRHLVQDSSGGRIGCVSRAGPCPLTLQVAQDDGSWITLDSLDFDLPRGPGAATARARVDCAAAIPLVSFEVMGRLETQDDGTGPRHVLVVMGVPDDFMHTPEHGPHRECCESRSVVAR